MFYHVEERRLWIRRGAHTVVRDNDPDYSRFAQDETGSITRILRIWLAEPGRERPYLCSYLGAVTFCDTDPPCSDIFRLFRFSSRAADDTGEPSRTLRHVLANLLRDYRDEGKGYTDFEAVSRSDIRINKPRQQLLAYNVRQPNWKRWYQEERPRFILLLKEWREQWQKQWREQWRIVRTLPVRAFRALSDYRALMKRTIIWLFVLSLLFAAVYASRGYWATILSENFPIFS